MCRHYRFNDFPSHWKSGKVLSLPKISNPSSTSDFRPICILPVLSKVLEILMKSQMVNFMSGHVDIDECQSGFRSAHSTTSAIQNMTESIRKNMDIGNVSLLVLLDFSRAFDCIDHARLCVKMKTLFAFSSSACNLISSYLTGRKQYFSVGGDVSGIVDVSSGVPQGSILGPLRFSIYIID